MEKYELYKNKDINELKDIINDSNSLEEDKIVASIIVAETEEEYEVEDTFNEILCCNKNKKIC